jgi:hypothetical protein
LQVFDNGAIHLQSSAVSVLNEGLAGIDFSYSNSYDTQTGAPLTGVLTADQYSYVQPVNNQNAASLKTLFNQPSLITSLDAYVLDTASNFVPVYYGLPQGAYPNSMGALVGVILDAGSTNKLISPIDGSEITTDVYGNPRTSNNRRDIGAVQLAAPAPAPLPLLGLGAVFGWSRRLRQGLRQRPSRP